MPCYHPMRAAKTIDGEMVFSYGCVKDVDSSYRLKGDWKYQKAIREGGRPFLIKCGRCIGCRLDYSREWATRCVLESKLWLDNWWITLTYDPDHIGKLEKPAVQLETGELVTAASLDKEELKDFMKRLRDHWSYHYGHGGIRYFGCGEYGSKNHRPHFHLCLFNFPLYDLKHWFSRDGFATLRSEELEKVWGNGLVSVNALSWENAAYTARYMLKKAKGDEARLFKEAGFVQEYTTSSLKPGIGFGYYEQHKEEIYRMDGVYVRGHLMKPPRYFDKYYEKENPEHFEQIKEQRWQVSDRQLRNWLTSHDSTYRYYKELEVQEAAKADAILALARKYEMQDIG